MPTTSLGRGNVCVTVFWPDENKWKNTRIAKKNSLFIYIQFSFLKYAGTK
jgi:hypothetical protein